VPAKRRARWSRRWAADRLAVVSSPAEASVLLHSTPLIPTRAPRARGIEELTASEATNMSAALRRAAPELSRGRGGGRGGQGVPRFDGQATKASPTALGSCAWPPRLRNATLSTFGIGDDYDEDLMAALPRRPVGARANVDSPEILPGAFRAELSRASALVARDVRLK